ncbi:hypothetical protein DPM19_23205 [Actinomadura craniellae]|uniref:CU044_5270 family protein n=2 Tax=Actinomadura craniellae TaxID=2231787 RepID=A0A365H1G1_9ACTN|nr:hypothetical protein DPM19_23205 [Actinomadura craniellae]
MYAEVLPPDEKAVVAGRRRLLAAAHDAGSVPARGRRRPQIGRGWRLAAPVGLTAALTAGVIVAAQGGDPGEGGGPGPITLRPVAAPQDLAHNAALVAANEPAGKAGPTRWAYLKTVFVPTQEGGGPPLFGAPKKTRTQEMWRRTDDRQFALTEGGRLRVVNGSKSLPTGVNRMDYPYLLSLPTRPDGLLAQVYKTVDAEYARSFANWKKPIPANASNRTREKYELMRKSKPIPPTAEERNARAFELITLYMRDAVLPPKIQAALYGAAAKIPGIRYEAKATDVAGRAGVTLYRVDNGYLRREIIINPRSYGYMGFRVVAIKDHREAGVPPVKQGQTIGWGALLEATFVSGPGQRS